VKVPRPPGSGKVIAKGKGVHREVKSEGSRRQSSGLTNRNRIEGRKQEVRLQQKLKPNNCTELFSVNAADIRVKECVSTRGGLAGGEIRSNNELQEVSRSHSTREKSGKG